MKKERKKELPGSRANRLPKTSHTWNSKGMGPGLFSFLRGIIGRCRTDVQVGMKSAEKPECEACTGVTTSDLSLKTAHPLTTKGYTSKGIATNYGPKEEGKMLGAGITVRLGRMEVCVVYKTRFYLLLS